MPTTITFTTSADLLCVVGAWLDMPVAQAMAELAVLGAEAKPRENHVTLVFRDPLDALLGAHHASRVFGERCIVMSAFASALACEMLREPTPLARDAIRWLLRAEDVPRGFLHVAHRDAAFDHEPPPEIVEPQPQPAHALVLAIVTVQPTRVVTLAQPGW
ncbi:MAG TPA: hypothetical protein VGC41_03990, partial [Kofleriaceae bacterium]